MKILVIEDEPLVAKRIVRLSREVLGEKLTEIVSCSSLDEATTLLDQKQTDLLLLDLNLNGKDGFELLQHATAITNQVIIISAHIDKAITAFEYGVLDFIGKPITKDRLSKAFDRYHDSCSANYKAKTAIKYLSIRHNAELILIKTEDIRYIKGSGVYVEICLQNDDKILHHKTLNRLESILPDNFLRVHKSYIVNLDEVKKLKSHGGSRYDLRLKCGETLPVGRAKYKVVKHHFS